MGSEHAQAIFERYRAVKGEIEVELIEREKVSDQEVEPRIDRRSSTPSVISKGSELLQL